MKKLLLLFLISTFSLLSQNFPQQNYGDSLKGWDEKTIKTELINHGVYGKEYEIYSQYLKREYINKKYNLNSQPVNNPPQILNKPIGGGNNINIFPCVNEDFESTPVGSYAGAANALSINGWTISSQVANSCTLGSWNLGSSKVWVVNTPILGIPGLGNLPSSPLGGNRIVKLNDNIAPYSLITRIAQSFPVTNANTLFQFAFAGVWNDGTHNCCEQPHLKIRLLDCIGNPLACSSLSLNAQGSGCPNGAPGYSVTGNLSWTSWQVKYIDLTPYIGTCVTIEVINSDCIFGGHWGMAFFDTKCGGQLIGNGIPGPGGSIAGPISFCAGSNQAVLSAPLGYTSYQWVAPGGFNIPAPLGTAPTITISNPVVGSSYSVVMTSPSGCQFTSVNTLSFTQVNIAGTNTTSSCPGGASGTATVYGNGSSTGYTYTWTNSFNQTVGTQSVATNLASGNYTVIINGGCGTASTTVNIPTQPIPFSNIIKPYCNNVAYFNIQGTGVQWYNNTTLVSNNNSYTLNNPVNGGFVHVKYTTLQGCQDSIKYILQQTSPGSVSILSNKIICPGANDGRIVLLLNPAQSAPPGQNSFSVFSTGSTPQYSVWGNYLSSNTFTLNNLAAGGTYSANVTDGSCNYSINFTPTVHVWNYTLSSSQSSLCFGNSTAAGVNLGNLNFSQYTYSWSPSTWLNGGNVFPNVIITPTLIQGTQSTIVYTVIVTPTISNCSITKTLNITAFNPLTPSIIPIPNLCNTSNNYSISITPSGGTFNTIPISNGGVINPLLSNIGLNTFTYSTSLYTCVASQTFTYHVSQFITSALTASIPPLCTTNPPINLMNIVQNTVNGVWSGNNITNNIFNPNGLNTGTYSLQYTTFSNPNPTVCPSITTLTVSVTNTIIPYIIPVPEICNIGPQIVLSANPSGGSWIGNGVTSNGIITPSLTSVPSSTIGYSLMVGPCLNTATTVLNVSSFNTASLTGVIPNLCYNSSSFNLMNIVQNGGGNWIGVNVNGNIFNPSNLQTGNYVLTYSNNSTPNPNICPDTKTIVVNVSNPPVPIITQVGNICSKNPPIQLTVTPNVGNWVSTSYLNNNGVFTPSLAIPGNNQIMYIIGTNTCNSSQTIFINVESFIPATLTNYIDDQCITSLPINLNLITLNNSGIWSGNGIIGSMFFPNTAGAGTHVLTYNTQSYPSGLCPDSQSLSVNVYSLFPSYITQIGPFCDTHPPIQLQVNPAGGTFSGNGINLEGLFIPSQAHIGNNVINYSVSLGPCTSYTQTIINIEKFISAKFEKKLPPLCKNSYPINLNSLVQNPGGIWVGSSMVNNMFNPNQANLGINTVYYNTNSIPTHSLCPDKDSILIEVKDIPNINITANKLSGCSPLEILFNTINVNTGYGEWNFGDNSPNKQGLSSNHVFTIPGTYSVYFLYDDGVCDPVIKTINNIQIHPKIEVDFFIPSEIDIEEPKIQILNLTKSLENNIYKWEMNDTLFSTQINPIYEFKKTGYYKVSLDAKTIKGCGDRIIKNTLVISNFRINIPNSFTPNHDGLNDEFYPVIQNGKKYYIEIFNKWGALLFSQENGKWNGVFKGEEVKEDIYVYKINAYKNDGTIITKMGHITLLR